MRVPASRLQVSPPARVALRRLKVKTLGELNETSVTKLRHSLAGSSDWRAIALDLGTAIERIRVETVAARAQAKTRSKPYPSSALIARKPSKASAQISVEDETISIPKNERGRAISDLRVSTRLGHFLDDLDMRRAGDLHGHKYVELREYWGGGSKTVAELRDLVSMLQAAGAGALSVKASTSLINPHLLFVAPEARGLKVSDLPLSIRLSHALQAFGCRTLGSLDRHDERELLRFENCGADSVAELRELLSRAAAGEFTPKNQGNLKKCLSEVIRAIDQGLREVSVRDRKILEQRLAGDKGAPRSLGSVGVGFSLVRESVRQVVSKTAAKIRKDAGPPLIDAVETVARACKKRASPLTGELFTAWLGQGGKRLARSPRFYLKVIALIAPEIPVRAEVTKRRLTVDRRATSRRPKRT